MEKKGTVMNILVLETDPRELGIIQQALDEKRNSIYHAASSGQAWSSVQAGGMRFMIVDEDTTDAGETQLIRRVRDAQSLDPIYILLITSRDTEASPAPGVDDTLRRPFQKAELKNRVTIAERIISLTSSLVTAREQLESQAAYDSLTGVMNRAAFLRQSAGELERSRRISQPLSLIAMDIDNFKDFNDNFGAETGDEVLKAVANTIREKSRPYDCVGRWTGDEFLIALPGVIGADAERISERIIAGVRGTRVEVPNEPPLNVRISAGVASIMRITTNTEIEPIIQEARRAVTRAKEAGGNQVYLVFL
ncbi:MAG: diguanylate cyclase [Anaerolineales bacterium]|nr:MAG: diguanylate cyclase [Chloroflexota bacterium]MCK6582447.1 diguanylate cyclase [Anaerolineales bacterium]GJQ34292.1 MAG: diguanylate cyclase response regulator [Anaerolineaceae bacterium]